MERRPVGQVSGVDPRAGTLPEPSDLIDVDKLLDAYHDRPDPANRVSFGTSGHRGTSLAGTFTEWHVAAISEAVCRYREQQGIDGPLFLGADTHALSAPAVETIVEVLIAHGVDVCVDAHGGATPTPVISHAILEYNREGGRGRADGIVVTPSHNPPGDGGFKYNPPHGGPADTDATGWIQDEANKLLDAELQGVLRVPVQPRAAGRHPAQARLRARLRGRPGAGDRPRRDPRVRPAARRRPARRGERRLLGGDRRGARARPGDRQRPARSDVPLRAARLGRQDPDGLLVALRDGAADRDARPLRRRVRQRPGRRPPRHRHAGGRAAEPQPPPRGVHRLPLRRQSRLGAGRGDRQDAGELEHHRSRGERPRPPGDRGAGRLQVVRRGPASRGPSASAARRARAPRSCAATAAPGAPTRTG